MDGFHRAAVLFYFLFLVFSVAVAVVENSLESDKNALVDLKSFLLSNNKVHLGKYRWWNENDVSPCGWAGITCAGGRVTGIDLSNSMPRGDVYPRFSSLTAHTNASKGFQSRSCISYSQRLSWMLPCPFKLESSNIGGKPKDT